MSTGFQRTRTGRTVLRVDAMEKTVLVSLAEQMIAFVAPTQPATSVDPLAAIVGIDEVAETPTDPA